MHGNRKYRWEDWFATPCTVLRRGQDYTCSQSTMVAQLRNRASKVGLRVKITDLGDSITLEVTGAVHNPNTLAVAE